jgi:hypothetical protein
MLPPLAPCADLRRRHCCIIEQDGRTGVAHLCIAVSRTTTGSAAATAADAGTETAGRLLLRRSCYCVSDY